MNARALGLYLPGRSPLHRAPAGVKLAGLALGAIGTLLARTPAQLGIAAGVCLALFVVARIPVSTGFRQIRPVLWVAAPLFAFQAWTAGVSRATVVVGQLVVLVAAAALVSLTTKVSAMLDAFETALGPLRRLGIDPGRVSFVLALTLRCIPLVARTWAECRDARRARGLERSPSALAVPLVVRLLQQADRIGEALTARGFDDR